MAEEQQTQMMEPLAIGGAYHIISKANDALIGRRLHEDRSLGPKHIVALPPGDARENAIWMIEPSGNETYILKCNGAVTTAQGHHLWAVLANEETGTPWTVKRHRKKLTHSSDSFGSGWVLPVAEIHDKAQIAVRPLVVFPSYPPQYPPNELFVFRPVNAD